MARETLGPVASAFESDENDKNALAGIRNAALTAQSTLSQRNLHLVATGARTVKSRPGDNRRERHSKTPTRVVVPHRSTRMGLETVNSAKRRHLLRYLGGRPHTIDAQSTVDSLFTARL